MIWITITIISYHYGPLRNWSSLWHRRLQYHRRYRSYPPIAVYCVTGKLPNSRNIPTARRNLPNRRDLHYWVPSRRENHPLFTERGGVNMKRSYRWYKNYHPTIVPSMIWFLPSDYRSNRSKMYKIYWVVPPRMTSPHLFYRQRRYSNHHNPPQHHSSVVHPMWVASWIKRYTNKRCNHVWMWHKKLRWICFISCKALIHPTHIRIPVVVIITIITTWWWYRPISLIDGINDLKIDIAEIPIFLWNHPLVEKREREKQQPQIEGWIRKYIHTVHSSWQRHHHPIIIIIIKNKHVTRTFIYIRECWLYSVSQTISWNTFSFYSICRQSSS